MEFRPFPKTGWRVSTLGLGCWPLGGQYGPISERESAATVRAALNLGINFFDTADAYGLEPGTSERILGEALRSVRGEVLIATKVGNWARRLGHPLPFTHPLHIVNCCHASLYRLRTDTIDLYQCHIGDLADPDIFLEAFDQLRKAGKIRAAGISTDDPGVLARFSRDGHCVSCQLDYSLLNRAAEAELLPACAAAGIGTLIRGPLAQGLLSGNYDASTRFTDSVRLKWNEGSGRQRYQSLLAARKRLQDAFPGYDLLDLALHYAAGHPAATVVIPGAKSPAQIRRLAAALAQTPPPDFRARVRQAVAG